MSYNKITQRAKSSFVRFMSSEYTPYIILYLVLLFFSLHMTNTFSDDTNYCTVLQRMSLWELTTKHYATWSARSLVEALLCIVGALPLLVWQLLNPFMIVFSAYAITRLATVHRCAAVSWAACAAAFLYTWFDLYTAGWVTTTMVYLWPLAAGLAALLLTDTQARRITSPAFIAAVLLALYSCNMEQMNVAMCIILCARLLRSLLRKARPRAADLALLACSIANFIYAFTCPGTTARIESEIVARYKNFSMQPFLSKIESGFSLAMQPMIFKFNALALIFGILLALLVFIRNKNPLLRAIAIAPLLCTLIFGSFGDWLAPHLSVVNSVKQAMPDTRFINISSCNSLTAYIPFVLLCCVFASWFISIYAAFGHNGRSVMAALVLLAGFCSRAAMGFSPTVGASGERTAFFWAFSLIFVCVMLFAELWRTRAKATWFFWIPAVLLCTRSFYSFWQALCQ